MIRKIHRFLFIFGIICLKLNGQGSLPGNENLLIGAWSKAVINENGISEFYLSGFGDGEYLYFLKDHSNIYVYVEGCIFGRQTSRCKWEYLQDEKTLVIFNSEAEVESLRRITYNIVKLTDTELFIQRLLPDGETTYMEAYKKMEVQDMPE